MDDKAMIMAIGRLFRRCAASHLLGQLDDFGGPGMRAAAFAMQDRAEEAAETTLKHRFL